MSNKKIVSRVVVVVVVEEKCWKLLRSFVRSKKNKIFYFKIARAISPSENEKPF